MMLKTVGQEPAVRWAQKNPNDVPNLLMSYRLALLSEQYNQGIESIDKCLANTSPETPEWNNFALKKANILVLAYAKTADKGYMERAIELFKKVLERYPENSSILNNLAYMLASNDEQLDEALQYARRAHQKEPGNPVYLDTYALTLHKNGQTEKALQNLLRAIQLYEISREPIPWDLYSHLGMVQEKLGETAKATDSYRKAMEATPKAPEKEQKDLQERINKLTQ
jgi:tetratricopeptide (TPR) repeat protein